MDFMLWVPTLAAVARGNPRVTFVLNKYSADQAVIVLRINQYRSHYFCNPQRSHHEACIQPRASINLANQLVQEHLNLRYQLDKHTAVHKTVAYNRQWLIYRCSWQLETNTWYRSVAMGDDYRRHKLVSTL